jgi:hypothetical protein
MTRKMLSIVTLFLLLLNGAGLSLATPRKKAAPAKQTSPLVAKLPASDAVAVVDARRIFDQALPQILGSKQDLLTKINGHISDIQAKTGIDVRKFDHIVIGANIKRGAGKDYDLDPVVLARGTMNAGSIIAAAKLGTNAGYREEKLGERTIYIFTPKSVADKNLPSSTSPGVSAAIDHMPAEIAVSTLDANTLVFGSPARVRETLEARSTVAPEITSLLSPRAASVFTFAARMPPGVQNLLPMDNDELGKTIESIKFLYGWTDVTAAGASMNVTARTTNGESAQSLYDTIIFLQQLGKGMLGSSKKPENAVYARLIDNAKVTKTGSDVALDLTVAQSDIDILLAALVKK